MAAAPPLFTAFSLFAACVLVCECGETISTEFERFYDGLCRHHWHLFPIEMQRMYLILLANTQHPVNIHSFFNVECTRETLKNVTKIPLFLLK